MQIAVTEAKAQLTDLVRRAEQGEEVVLTRFGVPVARLSGVKRRLTGDERMAIMREVQEMAKDALPGPCAARSQDFLYDENGLPA